MLGIPIEDIDEPTLKRFLETSVREGFALDFKRDFPSNLEKTLAAFANTYGGVVLIGIDEDSTGAAKLPIKGLELKPGLRERVLQIALDAVYPPVLPEVRVVPFKSAGSPIETDRAVVVVRVHESENAPHAVENRTTVYLRADSVSDRFERKATIGELEWLLNKRKKSQDEKSRLLNQAMQRAKNLRLKRRSRRNGEQYQGDGTMRFWMVPNFPRAPLLETRDWAQVIQDSHVQVPNSPGTLPDGTLQRAAGGLFYLGGTGYSEFHQQGLLFHEFDYWWNYFAPAVTPGARQLYPEATAMLLWGTLELGRRIYRQSGYPGLLEFHFDADELNGAFFTSSSRFSNQSLSKLVESQVTIDRHFSVAELENRIIEIAKECQRELYWAFGTDATDEILERDFRQFG